MKKLTYLFLALIIVACSSDDSSDGSSNDTTAPIITLNGQAIATVNLNSTYTDAGATALDDVDGDLTSSIVTTGVVNTSIEGNYVITYTVSDSAGNTATTSRQVIVEDDGNPVYLAENGVTIKAKEWALVGDSGVVNGIGYTIVDTQTLENMISNDEDVTRVCTSRIVDMSYMFNGNTYFNQPIGDWDVSNVTNMVGMFAYAAFNQPIGNWDVSNVTTMQNMFFYSNSFNQPIGDWNVSNVTRMQYMFAYAAAFNQDISSWSVGNVTYCANFSLNAPLTEENTPNFTNCTP
jgi:surface protein